MFELRSSHPMVDLRVFKTSVGSAVTIGQHSPAILGAPLVSAARQVFMSGSDHAVIVAAAALLGSLIAARFLPARADNEVEFVNAGRPLNATLELVEY